MWVLGGIPNSASTFFDVEDGREGKFSDDGDGKELVLGTLGPTRTESSP